MIQNITQSAIMKFTALSFSMVTVLTFLTTGCNPTPVVTQENNKTAEEPIDVQEPNHIDEGEMLILPVLKPVALNGSPLQVVATTSIIGDIVAQVGRGAIDLTVLIGPGVDPHSYQPGAQDLTVVENAHVIFVNGWDLEAGLARDLETIGGVGPVPVSAGISPLAFGTGEPAEADGNEDHAHEHAGADPHVWLSIRNVKQWVKNINYVLSELDPANAETFAGNAEAYSGDLEELETYVEAQLGQIPLEKRILVTNHDAFGYFANEYGFNVLGTVIPAVSTLAEPSASNLTELIAKMEKHRVCTIFTETTVSDTLAQTIAAELDNCAEVKVLALYSGSLGPVGSGAENYISMFRTNVDAIVEGLR